MSDEWEGLKDLKARLERGEPVSADEMVRAILSAPLPTTKAKRRPGRPRKWTDAEKDALANLCLRVRLLSEVETRTPDGYCRPMSMSKVHERVGAALRNKMEGKSLGNLLRLHHKAKKAKPGIRIFRDETLARLLRPEPPGPPQKAPKPR